MAPQLQSFLHDETGAISFDWLILTAVLAATGLSVVKTVSGGVGEVSVDVSSQLRGQVIRQSFGDPDLCSTGIDGLRAREAARVAAGGSDPVDVDGWFATHGARFTDAGLRAERDRVARVADRQDGWSRDHTIQGLLECKMAHRGI
ncbi:hypothetical protein [Jannaschia marina]|uniref:hypothetical protein n=1 Tax=Jannaschia marina TaxID=2741674 RepID=UPI0015CE95EE|nr:hypothetical protein [Jannaschia marina]